MTTAALLMLPLLALPLLLLPLLPLTTEAILTKTGRQPSILFIMSDDLRYDVYMTPGPSAAYKTFPYHLPNLERLMSTGVTFSYAFSNYPSWCATLPPRH